MSTTTKALPAGKNKSGLIWNFVVYGLTLAFAGGILVELINILFYDPYGDDYFLFRTAGMFAGVDISTLTWWMFGSLAVLLMAGLPLSFVTGGLGCVFVYTIGDQSMMNLLPSRIFPMMTNSDLSAIPLFIFMAAMLEKAGIIEEMFSVTYKWMGGLRGGLAAATIAASTILAAMVGVIGAAVVTMGILALPAMLSRNYDEKIALGSIMAGGTLGILIPPSILAILYAVVAQQSVGELYMGAIIPGLMLSGMYIAYVLIRSYLNKDLCPAMPKEELISFVEKLKLLKSLIAPLILVFLVLGLLFGGIATPVEAAGLGSFGAVIVAITQRKFSLLVLKEASMTTLRASTMVLWIMFGASLFVGFYILQGGQAFITESMLGLGLGPYGILFLMMFLLVILGMFLDWVGILLLAVPIFVPIIKSLTFPGLFGLPGPAPEDVALWFGILYIVNMQMSFLSPPFGYALFYIKGVCPPHIQMSTIFKASFVFLAMQVIGLLICVVFPGVITYFPNLIYG
ncbi:MAG: TRAP transporter large permease subunit [Desulfofustis sp.]|nr:TRAP transporter large permease subunit [Desulfofustis sp.]